MSVHVSRGLTVRARLSDTAPRVTDHPGLWNSSRFLDEIPRVYMHYIVDFTRFHGKRHPQELGVGKIQVYPYHLATDKNVRRRSAG